MFPCSTPKCLLVISGMVGEFNGVSVLRRAGILAGSLTLSTGPALSVQTAAGAGMSSSVKCVERNETCLIKFYFLSAKSCDTFNNCCENLGADQIS